MDPKGRPATLAEKNRMKALENKEMRNDKIEMKIQNMSDKEVAEELKKKGLGTFGTKAEREQRLRKAYGLGGQPQVPALPPQQAVQQQAPAQPQGKPGDKTVNEIERIKLKREERRKELERNVGGIHKEKREDL